MRLKECLSALILALATGCGQKSANLQTGTVPPDRVLYENGVTYLDKSQYIKARLAFQTLISTYPDSEFTPKAVMANGDSFYQEGGTANWLQAEAQYKDYILFYPNHEDADDAQMKIAALNYRMMKGPDLDQTYGRKAEAELKKMIQTFPESDLIPTVKDMLHDVEQTLARSEEAVGDFYLQQRRNYAAAENRYKIVVDKYPQYGGKDQTYFKLAETQEKQGRITEAVYYYSQVVIGYPFSDKFEEAKKRLVLLEQPVPPVDPVRAAENEKQRVVKDFSLWDPFRGIWSVFSSREDPYERARRNAAERAANEDPGGPDAGKPDGARNDREKRANGK
ncbi:MAG: outer membrane protein assembly factor BamD [Acidobacteria bacterium]|nr:outer membrane protein assembly factor BamD [Acidobacteriota bacterium]